jgi:hypothetical protein
MPDLIGHLLRLGAAAVLGNWLNINTLCKEGCLKSSSLDCINPRITATYPARPQQQNAEPNC